MAMNFTVKELQDIRPSHYAFSSVIKLLAKLGVLDYLEKYPDLNRKIKIQKEIDVLSKTIYLPKIKDLIFYEEKKTGYRFKCEVQSIDGNWVKGSPLPFNLEENGYFILEVLRDKKSIYRW